MLLLDQSTEIRIGTSCLLLLLEPLIIIIINTSIYSQY